MTDSGLKIISKISSTSNDAALGKTQYLLVYRDTIATYDVACDTFLATGEIFAFNYIFLFRCGVLDYDCLPRQKKFRDDIGIRRWFS